MFPPRDVGERRNEGRMSVLRDETENGSSRALTVPLPPPPPTAAPMNKGEGSFAASRS